MEKIKTLNKKHELILEQFVNNVDRFIYEITDEEKIEVFQNFIPLKHKARMLHNTLAKNIDDEKVSKQEWVFMLPNFLMFGAFGFAMALKKTKNQDILDLKVRELFEEMTETIYDLDEMLQSHFLDLEAMETLEKIINKKKQTK